MYPGPDEIYELKEFEDNISQQWPILNCSSFCKEYNGNGWETKKCHPEISKIYSKLWDL